MARAALPDRPQHGGPTQVDVAYEVCQVLEVTPAPAYLPRLGGRLFHVTAPVAG